MGCNLIILNILVKLVTLSGRNGNGDISEVRLKCRNENHLIVEMQSDVDTTVVAGRSDKPQDVGRKEEEWNEDVGISRGIPAP